MRLHFLYLIALPAFTGCSKNSGDPLASETWPKKGLLITTYADVGQAKKDTVYLKSVNFPEKRPANDPTSVTDKKSIWTISLQQDGSGQPSYVLIKNEDGEYLRIDSIGSPLGREEYILETGKPANPGNGYKFYYHKEPNGFKLESVHKKDWFVTSEGHSQGGNGYEFKKDRAEVFWLYPK